MLWKKFLTYVEKYQIIRILLNVLATIIIFCGYAFVIKSDEIKKYFDLSVFTSVILVTIINAVVNFIDKMIQNKIEDYNKETTDYKKLIQMYPDDLNHLKWVVYNNSHSDAKNLKRIEKTDTVIATFPVVEAYQLKNCDIVVQDSQNEYEVPSVIKDNAKTIFQSHSTSQIYNQLNIRVDDWNMKGHVFTLKTSRTHYFKSLVTNRAIDYPFGQGITVRSLLECGPFLHPLSTSLLSNHLGFNGFIESSDGKIAFIKRNKSVSIAKHMYGSSVSASLKAKYALDGNGDFSVQGLLNGIEKEIKDECKIEKNEFESFSTNNIFSAYRDVKEGGKPQLLFFLKIKLSSEKLTERFNIECQKAKKNTFNIVDGNKIQWIPKQDLKNVVLQPNYMIHNGRKYAMEPSTTASIALLIKYFVK